MGVLLMGERGSCAFCGSTSDLRRFGRLPFCSLNCRLLYASKKGLSIERFDRLASYFEEWGRGRPYG